MTAPYIPAYALKKLKDACEEGHATIIKQVIDQYPSAPNAWLMLVQMSVGTKPLLLAADSGDYNAVKVLLEAGAEVEARMHINQGYVGSDHYFRDNCTALLKILKKGHKSMAELMTSYNADITAMTGNGATAVHCAIQGAIQGANIEVLDYVLGLTPPDYIDQADDDGVTPLILACRQDNAEDIVVHLLDKKADINKPATIGQTPLEALVTRGARDAFIQFMIDSGADVNAVNKKDGTTSLMIASKNGMENAMRILLANGADPYMHNQHTNMSTLGYASTQGCKDIILQAQDKIAQKKIDDLFMRENLIIQSGTREKTRLVQRIKVKRPF